MKTTVPFINLGVVHRDLEDEINATIAEVARNNSFVSGPCTKSFEHSFAKYCQVACCVGVANGTDAIFLALKALGVGPGDEVITTPLSFIATLQAIVRTGAEPRFVDIDSKTYNIDPRRIEEAVTPRTRAIVPVHLYGLPADMTSIVAIAKRRGIRVIEDAAQAHGAEHSGRKVGSLGDMGCFSFYPSKNLGAWGDAGAVVTNDPELAERIRSLANHGNDGGRSREIGYNSRLDGLQAAVLGIKLRHLTYWNDRRRAIADKYKKMLSDLPVQLPCEDNGNSSVFHLYSILVEANVREGLRSSLEKEGIETRVYYQDLLSDALCNESASPSKKNPSPDRQDFPIAREVSQRILSLPIYPTVSNEQVSRVATSVQRFFLRKP